ncbi:hypothetical protein [Haloarchaeobius sp. HME9146]|nr:hypothetical protein [Haloarchaeobius sp. HME9146]MCT9097018.1 hypothetical protein [Haloarchaeobius sp. HME9146]
MEEDNDTLANYLAEHPRMIGVLFMIGLLLMQAAPVAAGNSTNVGP